VLVKSGLHALITV